jgi:drug/metabolite transporter (DMT)-like permease
VKYRSGGTGSWRVRLRENRDITAYAALTAAVLFWGVSFVATKVALESITTFTLIFVRFGLAGLVFLGVSVARGGLPRLPFRAHGKLFLMALFEPGLYFYFETVGLQHTTAPKAALIIATVPVAVLVFARVLIGERIRMVSLLGITMSLAGIGVLITGDPGFRWALGDHLLGDLLIIGAVITAALYMVGARDLGREYSAWAITCFQILYGALFYAPMFLVEMSVLKWSEVGIPSMIAAGYLTVFATVAAFLCYNYGLTRIEASRAAVFINGIPVVTAAAAWVILGERLTAAQAAGGAMVLLGVWLTNILGRPFAGERASARLDTL